MLDVAGEADAQVVEAPQLLLDGVEIEQGLGRVLTGAISAIDHRDPRHTGSASGRSHLGMAEHNGICVAADDANRVHEALAFSRREASRFGCTDDLPAEAEHGRLEREPCPSTG